jgi:D-alanyl-D-alanine carboxypeptidase/D-alanyl-D-alanine-endopeptidase (penicillin-binding protein 4)
MQNKTTSQNFGHAFQIKVLCILFVLALAGVLVPATHGIAPHRWASALQKASASPTPSPSPSPSSSPTPTTTAAIAKTGSTTRTVAELQSRITEVLRRPEFAQATIGVKIASLDSGRVLFEENAMKLLRPASNMKLYTVATALDRLSPDYRYTTSVYAPSRPDAAGTIRGDVTIYGRGDPSLAARFNQGDYFKGIDELANRIVAAGIKRIEGDFVGDESYFEGPQYGSGWEWEDLTWYYGAEISALTINDNALDLFVKPGLDVGSKAVITTGPPDPLLTIINLVTTSPKGTRRDLTIYRDLGKDVLTVSGTIAVDDRGYSGGVGISHPALLFVYLLRDSLAKKGVVITGRSRTLGPSDQTLLTAGTTTIIRSGNGSSTAPQLQSRTEIASLQSPPLSLIAAQTLKPSQNLYTELILRTLGKAVAQQPPPAQPVRTSEEAGVRVVKTFLKEAGISPETLVLSDGSGLSRDDMVTAEATVQLLSYMNKHRYADVFRAALPIAGVDGTLRNRLKGTVAENNLRAKTGSLSSASSLSGYVKTATGENIVFSIIVNNYPEDAEPRTVSDAIGLLLASFAGKSQ